MGAGTKLRQVLAKNGLVEAMAAHSPLSAMLAAEAGFDAIWASGFELSAMYGVPDVSVVSMTQHLDMTRAMVDRSGLPVVADIDTGFGNAINVLYAIEQYERPGRGGDRDGGQELPQGHQPDRRRPPGHGPHRGVPGQDRGGARGAARTRTS